MAMRRGRYYLRWIGLVLLALGVLLVSLLFLVRESHGFLSLSRPVPANILIVEGWTPDYVCAEAAREARGAGYDWVIAAGGPLEKGSYLLEYRSYAEVTGESLVAAGLPRSKLLVVPAAEVFRHRTFESARAVRERLTASGIAVTGMNVMSLGAHARRTFLVYEKVLGELGPVGVISVPSQNYDPMAWWRSSEGIKTTVSEGVGWIYEWATDSGRPEEQDQRGD